VNAPVDDNGPTASLQRQIDQAARQLAESRRKVGARRAALGRRLQDALTSPAMFLVAGASGFLMAELGQRKGRAVPSQATRPAARAGASSANLVLKIALQLVSLLHLATASPPYVRRPSASADSAHAPTPGAASQVH
jgi:hypothetical protein